MIWPRFRGYGRNSSNFSVAILENRWFHKFILQDLNSAILVICQKELDGHVHWTLSRLCKLLKEGSYDFKNCFCFGFIEFEITTFVTIQIHIQRTKLLKLWQNRNNQNVCCNALFKKIAATQASKQKCNCFNKNFNSVLDQCNKE